MFTINIYLKLGIIVFGIVGGTIMSLTLGFWYGFWFILIGLIMLASYIFLGTVQSAAQLIEAQDFVGAEKRINMTFKPNWLYATNKAYYYILQGSVSFQKKDNETGEMYFKKAYNIKLPSDNERGMVLLQLANLSASKNKWNEAILYHRELKELKVSEAQLKEQIVQFDKVMKNRGQMKHMSRGKNQGMYMQQGKSKRRRPKMR